MISEGIDLAAEPSSFGLLRDQEFFKLVYLVKLRIHLHQDLTVFIRRRTVESP
jgi:hypothetical protein